MKRIFALIVPLIALIAIGYKGYNIYDVGRQNDKTDISNTIVRQTNEIIDIVDTFNNLFMGIVNNEFENEAMTQTTAMFFVEAASKRLREKTQSARDHLGRIEGRDNPELDSYVTNAETLLDGYDDHATSYDKVYDLLSTAAGGYEVYGHDVAGFLNATYEKIDGLSINFDTARAAYLE